MKNFYRYLVALILAGLLMAPIPDLLAGNKDRSGQSGASELLINPWARSSGWGTANIAGVKGLEAIFANVAGIAFTQRTDLIFANTDWLRGADINLMSFGFAQRIGPAGVLGLSVMSMNFGDIEIREVDLPEGGIGTYSPNLLNIGLAYAKAFSNSIYGGMTFKIISESISDASAQGIAIDAGIQYVTGEQENVKFGISLRNVGPKMKFTGDGFSLRAMIPGQDNLFSMNQRSVAFELPAQLNIGASYDFLFERSRFTVAGAFTSNSFTKDQVTLGGEYSFRDYVQLRAGYTYESGIEKDIEDEDRSNALKGPSAGFSVQVPLNKEKGSVFAVDYSYRHTDHFNGTHSIGVSFSF
ncbi:MAG: PorV/PorQ family protein [Bacteroidales bacterium]|nr:PorV/PorQ family protein [Bacteroidales bacterium]